MYQKINVTTTKQTIVLPIFKICVLQNESDEDIYFILWNGDLTVGEGLFLPGRGANFTLEQPIQEIQVISWIPTTLAINTF
jgi:hypothetical protein